MTAAAGVAQASHALRLPADLTWHTHARCRGTDADKFYPEKGGAGSSEAAKRLCRVCPVRGECLRYAMDAGELYGVWGGFNQAERRVMRREQRRVEVAVEVAG